MEPIKEAITTVNICIEARSKLIKTVIINVLIIDYEARSTTRIELPLHEYFSITLEQHPDQIIVLRWNYTHLIKYVHVSAMEYQVHDYVSRYNYIMQVSSFFLVVKEKEGR